MLTPDDKNRIKEEETARFEAQESLKAVKQEEIGQLRSGCSLMILGALVLTLGPVLLFIGFWIWDVIYKSVMGG